MIYIEGWYRRLSGLEGKSYFFRMATEDVGVAVLVVVGLVAAGCKLWCWWKRRRRWPVEANCFGLKVKRVSRVAQIRYRERELVLALAVSKFQRIVNKQKDSLTDAFFATKAPFSRRERERERTKHWRN